MPESAHESRQVTSRRSHRVFIGPINVASYYSGLQAGLRELGTDAELVLFTKHRYLRNALQAKSPKPVVFLDWCVNHVCQVTPSRSPTRTLARILFPFAKALVFLWSLVCCDVFVFAAAKGFYSLYELPFLKLLGKRLIFVFNGSESRPAYLGGAVVDGLSRKPIERMIRRAARQKQRIRWIEKIRGRLHQPRSAGTLSREALHRSLCNRTSRVVERFVRPSAPGRRQRR